MSNCKYVGSRRYLDRNWSELKIKLEPCSLLKWQFKYISAGNGKSSKDTLSISGAPSYNVHVMALHPIMYMLSKAEFAKPRK